LKDRFNNHVVRKDKKKLSSVAPNVAMVLPNVYGAENWLQPVNSDLIGT
jgi:hypothetical protein